MKYRMVKTIDGRQIRQRLPETDEEVAEIEKRINAPGSGYYDGFSGFRATHEKRKREKRAK